MWCSSPCSRPSRETLAEYVTYQRGGRRGGRPGQRAMGHRHVAADRRSTPTTTSSEASPAFTRYDVLFVNSLARRPQPRREGGSARERARRRAVPLTARRARTRSSTRRRSRCTRSTSSRPANCAPPRAVDGADDERADARGAPPRARRDAYAPHLARRARQRTRADLVRKVAEHLRQTFAARRPARRRRRSRAAPRRTEPRSGSVCATAPDSARRVEHVERDEVARVVTREHGHRRTAHELGGDRPLVDGHRRAQLHRHPAPQRRVEVVAPGEPGGERLRLGRERRRASPVDGDRHPALVLDEEIGERGVGVVRDLRHHVEPRLGTRIDDHLAVDQPLEPVETGVDDAVDAERVDEERDRTPTHHRDPIDEGHQPQRARHARPGAAARATGLATIGASEPSKSTRTTACRASSTRGWSAGGTVTRAWREPTRLRGAEDHDAVGLVGSVGSVRRERLRRRVVADPEHRRWRRRRPRSRRGTAPPSPCGWCSRWPPGASS